jgi:hypothetical protein
MMTAVTCRTESRVARRRRELDRDRDEGRRLNAIAAGGSFDAGEGRGPTRIRGVMVNHAGHLDDSIADESACP